MKKFKYLVVTILVVMLAGVLAGCAGDPLSFFVEQSNISISAEKSTDKNADKQLAHAITKEQFNKHIADLPGVDKSKYDDSYFAEHDMLLVSYKGQKDLAYTVKGVSRNGNTVMVSVTFDKIVGLECYNIQLLTLDKGSLDGVTDYNYMETGVRKNA